MEPGSYNGLSNAEYHAADGISKSGLDQIARSPAHYQAWLDAGRRQTDAFSIGTEAHRLILEPETESLGLLKPSTPRRSKEEQADWQRFFLDNGADESVTELPAAEWDAEFTRQTGRYLLTKEQFCMVRAMSESVFAHPSAAALLGSGIAEQSIFWTDADTGELCRCRPDWTHDNCVLIDIKTTVDASPTTFSSSVAKYRYHVQDAFYSDGFAAAHNLPAPPPFIFIVVEKAQPYAVSVYQLDPEATARGRELYRRDLIRLAEAKRSECWNAYSDEIALIDLPAWAYY